MVHHLNDLLLAPTTLPDATPLEYIEAAAHAGYRSIGLRLHASPGMPFHPVAGDAALIRAMKDALQAGGLRVLDVYSFYLQPATDVATFRPAIELAAEFGAKYLVTMGADPDWSRTRDNFVRICELARPHGLICMLEPAVIRPLATFAQAEQMIRESGCDNAGIVVDPLNFARAGETAPVIRNADPKLMPYAQITDGIIAPGEPDPALLGRMSPNRRTLLGHGDVPLDDIFAALPQGIPLSIELPPPDGSRLSPTAWARLVRDDAEAYLRGYYAQRRAKA
jgi:sugar phosphate isomerase/epimerase